METERDEEKREPETESQRDRKTGKTSTSRARQIQRCPHSTRLGHMLVFCVPHRATQTTKILRD
jgi:hypothetical protein